MKRLGFKLRLQDETETSGNIFLLIDGGVLVTGSYASNLSCNRCYRMLSGTDGR